MLEMHTNVGFGDIPAAAGRRPRGEQPTRALVHPVRHLCPGDVLFHAGDSRSGVFRVVSGALVHHIRWPDGRHEVIGFAFPGDVLGWGSLDEHISTAQATVATVVESYDEAAADALADRDEMASVHRTTATDREFDFLKARALGSRPRSPEARLAALLSALSHTNDAEGRDPSVIGDDIGSNFVAEQLALSAAEIGCALEGLRRRGLVAPDRGGLRLADVTALEKFAEAA